MKIRDNTIDLAMASDDVIHTRYSHGQLVALFHKLRCFECSDTTEIRYRTMFILYPGLLNLFDFLRA